MASQPTRKALLERIRQLEQDIARCQWDCRTVQRQLDYNQKILDSLRESEAKFKTLFENASDYIVYVDVEGTILETNDAVEQLTGFKREEVVGRNFAEIGFTTPELAQKAMKLVRDVFAGRPTQITEYENLRKDGTPVYIEANPRLVRKGGKPLGILAVIRDITERKRAEEALQESEHKARALLNATLDAVMLLDRSGRILDLNGTCAARFQKGTAAMIGLCLWDFLPREQAQKRKALVDQVIRTGKAIRYEDEDRGVWNDRVIYPVLDARGRVSSVALFAHDITMLKQAESELRKHGDHLEEVVQERTANLEEANTALRVLLKRREEDRIELEENVLSNVKETVIPFLKKTRQCRLDDEATAFLGIAESNLNDIVTPFMRGICNRYSNLTPTEVQIVNFVLQGKRTKEIAESLHVSPRTVEFHRNNIRKKLGIDGKKVNLRTHLLSLQ